MEFYLENLARSSSRREPGIGVGNTEDWMIDGACASIGGDLWFPEKGHRVALAVKICQGCPVRDKCLEFALTNGEVDGIWGGLLPRERQKIRVRRCKTCHTVIPGGTRMPLRCDPCRRAAAAASQAKRDRERKARRRTPTTQLKEAS